MHNQLKIAVVTDQLLPGGVQKQGIQEVIWLNKLGYNAKLLILMRKGFEKKYSNLAKDCPYEFLSDRYPKIVQKSFKFPIFSFFSTLHLLSPILAPLKVKVNEFDLIISLGTTTSLTMWSLAKFRKIPYIAVIHDPMVYILEKVYRNTTLKYFFPALKPLASFFEKRFTLAASKCLVISKVHAKNIEDKYGVKPEILYLPVTSPKKLPPKRGKAILSFGRWQKEKNPELLLKIVQEIKDSHLVMAGSWTRKKDYEDFKQKIQKLKIHDRVKLIPKYKDEDLPKICRLGRVWVHPHFEAFSLSALEAAANGLPIIIPEGSGVTELFENGVHGYFPKEAAKENLTRLILAFLKNERLASKMGIKAARVAKNYSPRNHVIKLIGIIDKVVETDKVPQITAIETGHILGSVVAGGDKLLEEMIRRVKTKVSLKVVLPDIAKRHWLENVPEAELAILPPNSFEKKTSPFGVFSNYLVRIFQTSLILVTMRKKLIYSSTGIFPDTVPAFLTKIFWPKMKWIARIHHLSPPPNERVGIWWVNLGSHILQIISLYGIKKRADIVLVLNTKLRRQLINKGFTSQKLKILGGGVDYLKITKFKPNNKKGYDGVYLGRIHPAKGIYDLAPIWKEVSRTLRDAKLVVIGFGAQEFVKELKKNVKKEGLSKNVIITGYLPENKVLSILKNSKVFLFTDREAGFGLAAAEAMAAGLPVAGWDIGILGNVFKNGFLKTTLDDHKTFATHIIDLITNKEKRLRLSKMAQKEASQMDWTKTSKKFEKIIKDLG